MVQWSCMDNRRVGSHNSSKIIVCAIKQAIIMFIIFGGISYVDYFLRRCKLTISGMLLQHVLVVNRIVETNWLHYHMVILTACTHTRVLF